MVLKEMNNKLFNLKEVNKQIDIYQDVINDLLLIRSLLNKENNIHTINLLNEKINGYSKAVYSIDNHYNKNPDLYI